jgi:hypothetical protein
LVRIQKRIIKRYFAYREYKNKEDAEEEDEKDYLKIRPTFLYSKKVNVNDKNNNELLIFKANYNEKHKMCNLI